MASRLANSGGLPRRVDHHEVREATTNHAHIGTQTRSGNCDEAVSVNDSKMRVSWIWLVILGCCCGFAPGCVTRGALGSSDDVRSVGGCEALCMGS